MNRIFVVGACFLVSAFFAWSQIPDRVVALGQEQDEGVAAPFRGATTSGGIIPDLFPVRSTGVSTVPVRAAAEAFLDGLSPAERGETIFPLEDSEWRRWDNRPRVPRQGVGFDEMSESQRELAFDLLRVSLSAKGLEEAEDIMKLNETLAEMRNDWETFGHWLYWLTVMGTPSDTEPWGWQLDGHHLVINYFVLGSQVVMTPRFLGSEPVRAESGQFEGTEVLQDEQNMGLRFFAALDGDQQEDATLGDKTDNLGYAGAYQDNLVLDYAGIPATDLNPQQRSLLLDLIGEYVGVLADAHAGPRMDQVRNHLDSTYFAWMGSSDPDGVFYYRIQSPVILIEFDHQRSGGVLNRNHIHTVVRTPNGNDYGKDLLRQHYAEHPHPAE
jgi:hypothetical protein